MRTVYVYENDCENGTTFLHTVTDVFSYVTNRFLQECHFVNTGYMLIEYADYTISDVPLEGIPLTDKSMTLVDLLRSVGESADRYVVSPTPITH